MYWYSIDTTESTVAVNGRLTLRLSICPSVNRDGIYSTEAKTI